MMITLFLIAVAVASVLAYRFYRTVAALLRQIPESNEDFDICLVTSEPGNSAPAPAITHHATQYVRQDARVRPA
jgi:hypothetical protein